MKIFIFLLFLIPNLGFSASMNHIGEKGEPSEVDRVIKIEMFDNYFEPNEINIKKNETIKFLVHNYGSLVHEFNIGTKKMHLKHQPEMMEMIENEILLGDKIDYKKMNILMNKMQRRNLTSEIKNYIQILMIGLTTSILLQLIFVLLWSTIIGATEINIRGRELLSENIPCNPGTNGTSCICPNTNCLEYSDKINGCHPINCWKWNEIKNQCEEDGKEFIPAIILQSIPITGVFGSGFGNMGRWDIYIFFEL